MADGTFDNLTANVSFKGQRASGTDLTLEVPAIIDGTICVAHAIDLASGVSGRFGSGSDHTHFEHNNFHSNVKQKAIIYMFRGHGNPNSVALAGKSLEWAKQAYGATRDSIDTTSTAQNPASPIYTATVLLRFTNQVTLNVNTAIQLEIKTAIAGIQAAIYAGKVVQAPTPVGGKYEVKVDVDGFDPLHWDWNNRGNVPNTTDWILHTITASPVQSNKAGIDFNYESRADQILVKFNAAHNLSLGDVVLLQVTGTGLQSNGLNSADYNGYVSKVVTTNNVAVVLTTLQNSLPWQPPPTSGTTTNTTDWNLYPGIFDPRHHLFAPAQCWAFWRNASGVTTRLALGGLTVVESDYSGGIGFNNFIKSGATYSYSVGYLNKVTSGTGVAVLGTENSLDGSDSFAVGKLNSLTGSSTNKAAFGVSNAISIGDSYAFGKSNSISNGSTSLAAGHSNTINGAGGSSHAFGHSNTVNTPEPAGAFGYNNSVTHGKCYLFGRNLTSGGTNATEVGWGNSCKVRFDSDAAAMALADAMGLVFGSTTGNKIGTATTQKLAFHGATPTVQRASSAQAVVSTTAATNVNPYGFTTAAQADAIVTLLNEIRQVLVEKGLMKGSA
ncbi:MAG: hypothetical protein HYY24_10790 [Verrucomicrobia bacterium]|nr:hypothetical protein [Verrucomicrobiota bacterium]